MPARHVRERKVASGDGDDGEGREQFLALALLRELADHDVGMLLPAARPVADNGRFLAHPDVFPCLVRSPSAIPGMGFLLFGFVTLIE